METVKFLIDNLTDTGKIKLRLYAVLFLGILLLTGSKNILRMFEGLGENIAFGVFFSEPFWPGYIAISFVSSVYYVMEPFSSKKEIKINIEEVTEKLELIKTSLGGVRDFQKERKAEFINGTIDVVNRIVDDGEKIVAKIIKSYSVLAEGMISVYFCAIIIIALISVNGINVYKYTEMFIFAIFWIIFIVRCLTRFPLINKVKKCLDEVKNIAIELQEALKNDNVARNS